MRALTNTVSVVPRGHGTEQSSEYDADRNVVESCLCPLSSVQPQITCYRDEPGVVSISSRFFRFSSLLPSSPHRWTRSPAFLSNRCSIVSISRLSRFAEVWRSRTELTGECEYGASVVPPRPLIGDVIQISPHRSIEIQFRYTHNDIGDISVSRSTFISTTTCMCRVLLTANGTLDGH
ncbi:uncharacterized protein EURHEDRAFT_308326 [Aspergillus ruber CBS 135680]|uniref:Uncharacterized protein n=1 Tax=Aspergillus ruber (strain CBS 135680) TaxID=1388766 RepID=A0A017S2J3_ASPRC|nr:uncharacterized protein EURHEDRAFT_308326 [Aspergillus ruber CBS 135680]EYE90395.1 hypothetical protein EURHEDRAFT_308326 [Aspergillus ruber CBS 135680]